MSSVATERVFLITGANKGIGFCLVKKLINTYPQANTKILLGSRDLERGRQALKQLNHPPNVHLIQLDTSSRESILAAVAQIKQNHGGALDVVVNNAAISTEEINAERARELFQTNYYGVKMVNNCLIPLMRPNGRIINVSSRVGPIVLGECSPSIQRQFTSSTLTEDQLDALVEEFISSIAENNFEKLGYNTKSNFLIYRITKAAVNALTQIEARRYSGPNELLFVSVTPGLCATDMTRHIPNARSPELGADSIFFTIDTCSRQLENGGFYRDGKRMPLIEREK